MQQMVFSLCCRGCPDLRVGNKPKAKSDKVVIFEISDQLTGRAGDRQGGNPHSKSEKAVLGRESGDCHGPCPEGAAESGLNGGTGGHGMLCSVLFEGNTCNLYYQTGTSGPVSTS